MNEMSNSQETSECCGECFDFDVVNLDEVSDFKFYAGGGKIIIVVYVKDGSLFFSISYDCGKTFEPPEEITLIGGTVSNIDVLTKGDQFVVALKVNEADTKKDVKRVISGWIFGDKKTEGISNEYKHSKRNAFLYKPCAIPQRSGRFLNTSLSFRHYFDDKTGEDGEESVDHDFYLDDDGKICMDCNGHRCVIK
jgi:hypothetical protein